MEIKMNDKTRLRLIVSVTVLLIGQILSAPFAAGRSSGIIGTNRTDRTDRTDDRGTIPAKHGLLSDAGSNQGAQDQPIRVKTELIDLRAVVTDKHGQPITDLKREDFELTENGKPQEVSFFSAVKIPGRGEVRQPENSPSNVTPGIPAGTTRPAETIGRTVLLYVDTLHLSTQSLLSVKQSLRKFIDERLTDQDLTAIVTSAGSLGVVEQ